MSTGSNHINNPVGEFSNTGKKPAKKRRGNFVSRMLDGTFVAQLFQNRWYPLMGLATLLGLIYIANTYYAVSILRKTNKVKRNLIELNDEFTNSQTALSDSTKQSRIAKKLIPAGIHESVVPPVKITISAQDQKQQNEQQDHGRIQK
jgi:hypothetical protein